MSSGELINTDNEEEQFFNSDKVVSIVNLLTKFKIKLWEMEYFESTKDNHHIEVCMPLPIFQSIQFFQTKFSFKRI